MSKEWGTFGPEQKSRYEKSCTEDKARYGKAMAEYNAKKKLDEEKNGKKADAGDKGKKKEKD